MSEQRRFWRVTMMYRGSETLIGEIPTTHITEERLQQLMRMVFAKHTLTDQEIVACHLRSNVKQHRNLLTVQEYRSRDPISFMVCDGSNWVHAIVVRPEDQDASPQSE
jgi:hypothetical protein